MSKLFTVIIYVVLVESAILCAGAIWMKNLFALGAWLLPLTLCILKLVIKEKENEDVLSI